MEEVEEEEEEEEEEIEEEVEEEEMKDELKTARELLDIRTVLYNYNHTRAN